MKLKLLFLFSLSLASIIFFNSCASGVDKDYEPVDVAKLAENQSEVHGTESKDGDIVLENPLNADWVKKGQVITDLKCASCHRLTDEKLVGPGWKDVTKKRKPLWIINMITNVDMMLESDPEAQKLLEQCLVRMPNQNISKEEARMLLEFMRSNDGEK